MLTVVAVAPKDFARWAEHIDRLFAESGRNGQPLFSPFEWSPYAASPERQNRFGSSLLVPIRDANWMRAWCVQDADGHIVGHLDLSGSSVPSENHRMMLGIGCEPAFRRQGIGTMLMRYAIDFAVANSIEWIDLCVFGDNAPAIALYERFGFIESGRRPDRFRLLGRRVEDVMMTLHVSLTPARHSMPTG
ncbi:GNAT family N-acetyltransferase [Paraburkholderia rhizosphaerae]|uniref:Acetyltransferase (GNAT) family protein n=1 Tax=Paraburkholderia rhizosphaerae TaxID=480658 RepID=A0A4R8M322_9BURK|nr:GNAT family N-acetyltransferase [Paraburkholderia rhizosphaerae]TDY54123.1 acetyltransferase (GNAT) family protein [Paraburkholderia rhizosphaerae]